MPQLLDAALQWLLVIATILFFVSLPMADKSRAWRMRRWSGGLVLVVFVVAVATMELRVHPIRTLAIVVIVMFSAYGVLEFRKYLKRRKPEPWVEYLNLRSVGKRPVDLEDHPDAFTPRDETPEERQ